MGRRRRNHGPSDPRSSAPPPPAVAAVQNTASPPVTKPLIADICKRSLPAILRADYLQVIRKLEKDCRQQRSFALIHLLLADANFAQSDCTTATDQQSSRHHHLKSAASSARKAGDLSPSNFEFAFTYAQYMYSLANFSCSYDDYAETIKGCERALAIVEHVESPEEKLPQNWPRPPKSRSDTSMSCKRNELVELMDLAKVGALFAFAEEFGGINLSENDSIEEDGPPSSPLLHDDVDTSSLFFPEWPSFSALKSQKVVKKQSKIGEVSDYVSSLTSADLSNVLVLKVSDVEKFLCLQNVHEHATTFLEAVSFAYSNRSWEFWTCFTCNLKFGDGRSLIEHVRKKHMGFLSPELHYVLSKQRCADTFKGIVDGVNLTPFDVPALLAMHEKSEGAETIDSSSSDGFLFTNDLIFSGDRLREKFLLRICALIRMLDSYRVLSHNHLLLIWVYAVDGIRAMPSGSQLLKHNWGRLPVCLSILDTPALTKIFEFLLDLSKRCNLDAFGNPENLINNLVDVNASFVLPETENPVRLYLAGDDPLTLKFDDCYFSADSGEKIDVQRMLDWLYSDSFAESTYYWSFRRDQQREYCNMILQTLTDTCHLIFYMHKKTTSVSIIVKGLHAFVSYLEDGSKQRGAEFDEQVASLAWRSVLVDKLVADAKLLYEQNIAWKKWDVEEVYGILKHIRAAEGEESVVKALQKRIPKLELEVHSSTAAILQKLSIIEDLQSKLMRASCYSYRQFVISAVQFFLREFLEKKVKVKRALSDVTLELLFSDNVVDKKMKKKMKQAPGKKNKQGKK